MCAHLVHLEAELVEHLLYGFFFVLRLTLKTCIRVFVDGLLCISQCLRLLCLT